MKTPLFLVFLLLIGCTASFATTESPKDLQMGYAMQKAVLRDQDLAETESLLKAGFPVSGAIGCGGYTPLDGAVNTENPAMAKLLIRYGAKPTERNVVRAAFINSESNAIDLVRQFLAAGVDVNSCEHNGGPNTQWRALDQAVWRQHGDLVKLLLAQKGIEVNYVDGDGMTPLMTAVEKGDRSIVQTLLLAGADPRLTTPSHQNAFTISDQQIENQRAIQRLLGARGTASN